MVWFNSMVGSSQVLTFNFCCWLHVDIPLLSSFCAPDTKHIVACWEQLVVSNHALGICVAI